MGSHSHGVCVWMGGCRDLKVLHAVSSRTSLAIKIGLPARASGVA